MLIGLGNNMTFGFTRSKIKDTMVLYVNNEFHSFLNFHMLFGLSRIMTPIDFGFTRLKVKVTNVTCKNVFAHYLENRLS